MLLLEGHVPAEFSSNTHVLWNTSQEKPIETSFNGMVASANVFLSHVCPC